MNFLGDCVLDKYIYNGFAVILVGVHVYIYIVSGIGKLFSIYKPLKKKRCKKVISFDYFCGSF